MILNDLRRDVCEANRMLPQLGLVVMHSGNASGYDPRTGRMLIKPSGVDYHTLTPEMMVEVDVATGKVVSGDLRPSVDLPHHRFLYMHIPDIKGIVHTHSNFATAFAAVNTPIPLCLTAIADVFGGEVPCTPYVDNQGDHIGRAILRHRTEAPAILLGNHGVFTWGHSPGEAIKVAAVVEDVAKTVHLALQVGQLRMIPQHEANKWNARYSTQYGQSTSAPRRKTHSLDSARVLRVERKRRAA